jgi:hypothetical protein
MRSIGYPVSRRNFILKVIHVPYLNHPYQDALIKPWKQGDKYVVYEYTGKMKQSLMRSFLLKLNSEKFRKKQKT